MDEYGQLTDAADEAAHHADQLAIQRDICEVIEKAAREPLNADDVNLLCWATGIDRRLVDVRSFSKPQRRAA